MRYTEKQKAEFKERFRQTQRYQAALVVPVGGAVLLFVLGQRFAADLGVQSIALAAAFLLLVAAGFSFWNWRCPACGRYLGTSLNPTRCPGCGVALRSP
jgi:rubrerythrin